jgi:hypothetical protein
MGFLVEIPKNIAIALDKIFVGRKAFGLLTVDVRSRVLITLKFTWNRKKSTIKKFLKYLKKLGFSPYAFVTDLFVGYIKTIKDVFAKASYTYTGQRTCKTAGK